MSKPIKKPIKIPDNVQIQISSELKGNCCKENQRYVHIKGPKGELVVLVSNIHISCDFFKKQIMIDSSPSTVKFKGLYRSLIQSSIMGVTKGFTVKMSLVGIGMKVEKHIQKDSSQLVFKLGRSHDILYNIPSNVEISCESNTIISITGISKYQVGEVASQIRSLSKPDPYKGKGIRYQEEQVRLKEKR